VIRLTETSPKVRAPNPARQKAARARLADLFAYPRSVFVVHYACESFDPTVGSASPRVLAIGVRNLGTAQTLSFSIHEEIELSGCPHDLAPQRMDELEYRMLAGFFRFAASNKTARFAHWNMRDSKFGFEAIAHRFAIHGGDRRSLPPIDQLDLALTLGEIYGAANLPRPHFEKLAEMNGLSIGFLRGAAEPEAFAAGNYRAVRDSVIAKVALIAQFAEHANDHRLKTKATWYAMNAGRLREGVELFSDNPVKAWAGLIAGAAGLAFLIVTRLLAAG
jgi:hypothetical protein